ncbi:MAG: lytic transglycosylase domain-containing protein [Alphaproteobacteria bacterium]
MSRFAASFTRPFFPSLIAALALAASGSLAQAAESITSDTPGALIAPRLQPIDPKAKPLARPAFNPVAQPVVQPVVVSNIKPAAGPRTPAAPQVKPAAKPVNRARVKPVAITLPEILNAADVARYRRIFALQSRGAWGPADREIRRLSDRTLLGHVLFQRYMSRRYRSRYAQLRSWLARYADHPQAKRIYKLALRRKPRKAGYPRRPVGVALGNGSRPRYVSGARSAPRPRLSRRQRRQARYLRRMTGRHIARARFARAERYLARRDARRLLGTAGYDGLRARLAFAYLGQGNSEKAYAIATEAAARSGEYVPLAGWTAGLAAFRLGKYAEAAGRFETASQAGVSSWNRSAGAYWAARAHLRGGKPEKVNAWLDTAAQNARTFYGILARHQLGLETRFNWKISAGSGADMGRLLESAAAVRAIALIQVGRNTDAGRELRRLYRGGDAGIGAAILAIAEKGKLASASMRIARLMINRDGKAHDGGLYPVPHWRPRDGFTVDRAVVFAVMRQESAFRTRARSRVGARGLMQLMPRTASLVARDRSLRRRRGRNKLFNPALNMSLGQKYIGFLLGSNGINGNLMLTFSGYNAGPGAALRWKAGIDHREDPLFFLESIPYRETRGYVARVMANLWAYRGRLGQKPHSLDQVAAGKWPIYKAQDIPRIAAQPGK